MDFDTLKARGLFDQRLPRYTSYPPAPAFHSGVGAGFQRDAIRALDPAEPISLYLHIPFCERLCWFCACRTQGVRSLKPVETYLHTLEAELALMRDLLPAAVPVSRMHWGGGTPTILPPALITRLCDALGEVFEMPSDMEFSVEIDPTLVDQDKITTLGAHGMTRASIGVQDFAPQVQASIGREQSYDQTREAVEQLRAAGVASLNLDLVYGLPFQSVSGFDRTLDQVLSLSPDRVALFGYAHVPHMAKRQVLIPEAALPDDRGRYDLFNHASQRFAGAGLMAIGIDHFAAPEDSMAKAARSGTLRRNFQGYTVDEATTLLGLGASSISRFRQGFVQNAPQTSAHSRAIRDGQLSGGRGYVLTDRDRLHGRIIEMLMCDFAIDFKALRLTEAQRDVLAPALAALQRECGDMLSITPDRWALMPQARPLVRRLAHFFDEFSGGEAQYSRVS